MRTLVLMCLCCFGLTQLASAAPSQEHIQKIKKQVSASIDQHERISLETYDGRKLQGFVNESGAEKFVLGNEGTTTSLKYEEVKKIKVPVSRGKRIAILTAINAGIAAGLIAAVH